MDRIETAIRREFPGQSNAGLRARLRKLIAAGGDPWALRHTVALTAQGTMRLSAVQRAVTETRQEEAYGC